LRQRKEWDEHTFLPSTEKRGVCFFLSVSSTKHSALYPTCGGEGLRAALWAEGEGGGHRDLFRSASVTGFAYIIIRRRVTHDWEKRALVEEFRSKKGGGIEEGLYRIGSGRWRDRSDEYRPYEPSGGVFLEKRLRKVKDDCILRTTGGNVRPVPARKESVFLGSYKWCSLKGETSEILTANSHVRSQST